MTDENFPIWWEWYLADRRWGLAAEACVETFGSKTIQNDPNAGPKEQP